MNYKDKLYSKYVSSHTSSLYGKDVPSKSNFGVFNAYFEKFLPKNKKIYILDAGCGNGDFVSWLQSRGYENSEGIDISEEQIEAAQSAGIKNIFHGDIKNLTRGYDIIFLRDVLEHFSKEEVLDILENFNSRLSEGGNLIIQTVNAKNLMWGRLRHGDFTHDLAFTEESIAQVLKASGFNKVVFFSQRPVVHGAFSFIRYILWMIFELKMRFLLLIETGSWRGVLTQNLIVKAEK